MTSSTATTERERQLNGLLLAFLQASEKGQAPDRQRFLAEHPEFAEELDEFFAGRDCVQRISPRAPAGRRPSRAADLGPLGDFRLQREIGRGGMGIVYEARQISLDRQVALKVLPFAAALDPRQLQRFKNEAHAAALLHHPHIVPIYAVGCERDIHFYAMQYIEGHSLADMIQRLRQPTGAAVPPLPSVTHDMGPVKPHLSITNPRGASSALPPPLPGADADKTLRPTPANSTARSTRMTHYYRRVADLGTKAAEALEHAHQLGVVHRDVKPANILLDKHGELWITDFGVAMLQNSGGMTATGELVGTLRYMSPEQAGAQRGLVDHRTDVYSLAPPCTSC